MDRVRQFFSDNFMAPHGFCFQWLPEILWLHIIADLLIAVSYFSIPAALWYFAKKRPDMPFNRVFLLFATFITLCGLTHVFGIIVMWFPYYGIEGLLMLATGVVSAATALLVWRIMPAALTLPSPSELAEMNSRLAETNREIERQVKERTMELRIALQRADEASEAKSQFLANMSHEIRTPMNVVLGLSDILAASEPLSERQREYLGTLKTSAHGLLSILDDILDMSKVESQTYQIEQTPFNLQDSLKEAVRMMAVKAQEKGLDFIIDIEDGYSRGKIYLGDPSRLRQIIINLCNNAIKFTETGSVCVRLSVAPGQDGLDNADIYVIDTGIGIDRDIQAKIFEKFVQADSSVTRKYGGTGLGLSIARMLTELMRGQITVESVPTKGSTFRVSLPLKPATAVNPQEMKPINDRMEMPVSVRKKKILLVEDYAPNVMVATILLEQFGYTSDVAVDGDDAVAKAMGGDYDLILMDVQMPGKSGFEATRDIRAQEQAEGRTPVPILGMTAHAFTEDREKCREAGMNGYISKPYTAEDLHKKIKDLL